MEVLGQVWARINRKEHVPPRLIISHAPYASFPDKVEGCYR